MRFWIIGAAAAALLCAGQANAATWLQYQISGVGTERIVDQTGPVTKDQTFQRDIFINFAVEVDPTVGYPTDSGYVYTSDGVTYATGNNLTVSTALPNTLRVNNSFAVTMYSEMLSALLDFNNPNGTGLIRNVGFSAPSTGTLSYASGGGGYSRFINATVKSFSVVGIAPGISGVTVSAVPEPVTWAMMIFGCAAAGAMLRRDRRAKQLALA